MMKQLFLFFLLLSIVTSWFFTRKYLFFAVKNHLVDRPNERSSHHKVTARGGGIPFVILYCGYLLISIFIYQEWRFILSLLIGSSLVAVIGFFDDKYNLAAKIRIIFHILATIILIFGLNGIPELSVFGMEIPLGAIKWIVGIFFLVWFLNLYNFMDGINGLSGYEAIYFLSSFSFLTLIYLKGALLALLMLPLAALVIGFIGFNFPRARVFMGDAGSGFLGVVVAYFCLAAGNIDPSFLWVGLILLGVFVVDATWTLFVRLFKKQGIFSAHRSHAYQIISRRLKSHTKTTLLIIIINIVWLLPIAWLVASQKVDGALGLVIAYAPLLIVCFYFKAGWPVASSESA